MRELDVFVLSRALFGIAKEVILRPDGTDSLYGCKGKEKCEREAQESHVLRLDC